MNAAVDYGALAELRYQLRVFVSFSERASRELSVEPQQHQLLLAIKGLPPSLRPTLGVLAERLQLRHHSVVELVDRLERADLAMRLQSPTDRREILVSVTARGERLLRKLSVAHQEELLITGPRLLTALQAVIAPRRRTAAASRKSHEPQRTRERRRATR
ncbi:MAG TPA: MarR family transcriptional regulator [Polyangiales bacterium]|jgi:DNA-binding MarR family transcriptional regulator|nr:MarR family transcriptional regulator [Polyangiales bacterium]